MGKRRGKTRFCEQEQQKRREREREGRRRAEKQREKERETGGEQGPAFKRDLREHVQQVFLVAAAEDASRQDLKGRPAQDA